MQPVWETVSVRAASLIITITIDDSHTGRPFCQYDLTAGVRDGRLVWGRPEWESSVVWVSLIPAVHFGQYERRPVWETAVVRVARIIIIGSMVDSHTDRPFGQYERWPVWETAGVRNRKIFYSHTGWPVWELPLQLPLFYRYVSSRTKNEWNLN